MSDADNAKKARVLAAEIANIEKAQAGRDALVEKTLGTAARDKLRDKADRLRGEAGEIVAKKLTREDVVRRNQEIWNAPKKAREEARLQNKLEQARSQQEKGFNISREWQSLVDVADQNKKNAKGAKDAKKAEAKRLDAQVIAATALAEREFQQREKTNKKLDDMNKKLGAMSAGN